MFVVVQNWDHSKCPPLFVQIVVQVCRGISLRGEKEPTASAWNTIGDGQRHNVKPRKPDAEGTYFKNPFLESLKKAKLVSSERVCVVYM